MKKLKEYLYFKYSRWFGRAQDLYKRENCNHPTKFREKDSHIYHFCGLCGEAFRVDFK